MRRRGDHRSAQFFLRLLLRIGQAADDNTSLYPERANRLRGLGSPTWPIEDYCPLRTTDKAF